MRSDTEAQSHDGEWETRCLHCRRRLYVRRDGEALGSATLEHVVPQAWFGKRATAALTVLVGHDARGPGDDRARAVIARLLQSRLARWREQEDVSG